MTLTIDLEADEISRLEREAAQQGIDLNRYTRRRLGLIDAPDKTRDAKNQALIALIDSWRAEDATDDEEELTRRDEELEEFKANINRWRAENGERLIYP